MSTRKSKPSRKATAKGSTSTSSRYASKTIRKMLSPRLAEISRSSLVYDRAEATDDDHNQHDKDKNQDGHKLTSVACRLVNSSAARSSLVTHWNCI
jgi:hypothetical protein